MDITLGNIISVISFIFISGLNVVSVAYFMGKLSTKVDLHKEQNIQSNKNIKDLILLKEESQENKLNYMSEILKNEAESNKNIINDKIEYLKIEVNKTLNNGLLSTVKSLSVSDEVQSSKLEEIKKEINELKTQSKCLYCREDNKHDTIN